MQATKHAKLLQNKNQAGQEAELIFPNTFKERQKKETGEILSLDPQRTEEPKGNIYLPTSCGKPK